MLVKGVKCRKCWDYYPFAHLIASIVFDDMSQEEWKEYLRERSTVVKRSR